MRFFVVFFQGGGADSLEIKYHLTGEMIAFGHIVMGKGVDRIQTSNWRLENLNLIFGIHISYCNIQ